MLPESGLPSAAWPGATIRGPEADSDPSPVRWIWIISAGSPWHESADQGQAGQDFQEVFGVIEVIFRGFATGIS